MEWEWVFIAGGGVFAMCGAVFDWEWFMGHRKAQFLVKLFGRTGTRVFYGFLGTTLVVLSLLRILGVLS